MAEDINPVLRDKLITDRDAEAPRIRGLPDIAKTTVSADLINVLNQQLHVRTRRVALIQEVLDDLDRTMTSLEELEADGWPAPVSLSTLDAVLFTELQGEKSDLEAAVAVFRAEAAINISSTPSFTTQPPPPPTATGP